MSSFYADGTSLHDLIITAFKLLDLVTSISISISTNYTSILAALTQIDTDIHTTNTEILTLTNNLTTTQGQLISNFTTLLSNLATYQTTNVGLFTNILANTTTLVSFVSTTNSSLATLISNLATYQTTNAGLFNSMITDLLLINSSIATTNSTLSSMSSILSTIATNTNTTNTNLTTINTSIGTTNSLNTTQNSLITTGNTTLSSILTTENASKTDLDTLVTNSNTSNTNLSTINTSIGTTNSLNTTQNSLITTGNTTLASILTANNASKIDLDNLVTNSNTTNTNLSTINTSITSGNTSLTNISTNTGTTNTLLGITNTDLLAILASLNNIYAQATFNRSMNDAILTAYMASYVLTDFVYNSSYNIIPFTSYGTISMNDNNLTLNLPMSIIFPNQFATIISQQTCWNGPGRTMECRFGVNFNGNVPSATNRYTSLIGLASIHNGFQLGYHYGLGGVTWGICRWVGGRAPVYRFTVTTGATSTGNISFTFTGTGAVTFNVVTGSTISTAVQIANLATNNPGGTWGNIFYGVDQLSNQVYFTYIADSANIAIAGSFPLTTPIFNAGTTGVVGSWTTFSNGTNPTSTFIPNTSFTNSTFASTINLNVWNQFGFRYAYNGNMIVYLVTYQNNQVIILHSFVLTNNSIFPHMVFQASTYALMTSLPSVSNVAITSFEFLYESGGSSNGVLFPGQGRSLYTFDKTIPAANLPFPIISNKVMYQKNGYRNYVNTNALNMSISTTAAKDVLVQLFIFPTTLGTLGSAIDLPDYGLYQVDSNSTLSCLNMATITTMSLTWPASTVFLQNYIITAGSGVQVTFPYGFFSLVPGVFGGVCATTASTSGQLSCSFNANELL